MDHESETLARQAGDSKWKDGKINQAESAVLVTRFFSRKQIGFQLIDTECVRCVSDQRSMQPMNKSIRCDTNGTVRIYYLMTSQEKAKRTYSERAPLNNYAIYLHTSAVKKHLGVSCVCFDLKKSISYSN